MALKTYNLPKEELDKFQFALIKTNKGVIAIKLYPDEAPEAVANFAHLANEGFYNGLTFHRVIPNFVIQGGCPNGTGTGGPGWSIKCECDKNIHKHQRGTLSMAHAGRDTGGSQFFVCHSAQPHLDGVHTVFGDIEALCKESFETLDSIRAGDTMESVEIKTSL